MKKSQLPTTHLPQAWSPDGTTTGGFTSFSVQGGGKLPSLDVAGKLQFADELLQTTLEHFEKSGAGLFFWGGMIGLLN